MRYDLKIFTENIEPEAVHQIHPFGAARIRGRKGAHHARRALRHGLRRRVYRHGGG